MHDEKSIWVLENGDAVNIWSWNMEGMQVLQQKRFNTPIALTKWTYKISHKDIHM